MKEKFTAYQQNHLQEKIYVHTDKTFYLAGETIWFKLYNVDASFHKPFLLSGIGYVEITGNNQQPVLQAQISIDDSTGTGMGSFIIPASVASGNYVLRAYTNRMKNFSEDFFFQKSITIVNTLKPGESSFVKSKTDSVIVSFYPEGGNLVTELTSKVAVKIYNHYGNAIAAGGFITNQERDTVAKFNTGEYGIGTFSFKPKQGDIYNAVVTTSNGTVESKLPFIYDQGYVMKLEEAAGEKIKITLLSNYAEDDNSFYLLVHGRQVLKIFQSANLNKNNEAVFLTDKSVLADGINHFTIFNGDKKPVCERLFFKKPVHTITADINSVKEEYSTRNKAIFDIKLSNEAGIPVQADMSASVFLMDSLQHIPEDDITSYLLLASEFKEELQFPVSVFNSSSEFNKAMDEIMLTCGWRRFKWEDVLNDNDSYFEFLPEYGGQTVNGKIISKSNGQAAAGVGVYLSVPGKKFTLVNAVSNNSGDLKFIFNKVYDKNEMIFQPVKTADSNYTIDIAPAYSKKFSIPSIPTYATISNGKTDLLSRNIYMQVENTYNAERKNILIEPSYQTDTTLFYGHPDKEYYLDDYTRFLTMEEVLKEYVAEVIIKKQRDNFYFRVKDKKSGLFFDNDPLMLIDGVPVFDAGRIISFDPLKIKKIDVISGRYFQASQSYEGIVSFKTYEGDLAGFELNPNSVVVEYDGIQSKQEFYLPRYETREQKENRLPDFRNVLYWDPAIFSGNDGKAAVSFYTSDYPGTYLFLLQGISKEGLPVSAAKKIVVRKKK